MIIMNTNFEKPSEIKFYKVTCFSVNLISDFDALALKFEKLRI